MDNLVTQTGERASTATRKAKDLLPSYLSPKKLMNGIITLICLISDLDLLDTKRKIGWSEQKTWCDSGVGLLASGLRRETLIFSSIVAGI